MPVEEALRFATQVAQALEATHAKGILHRDLKPGNILVSGNGVKLLDFGLAKATGDSDATQTLAVSGTPVYMSPEQAEGKTLDARSDISAFAKAADLGLGIKLRHSGGSGRSTAVFLDPRQASLSEAYA